MPNSKILDLSTSQLTLLARLLDYALDTQDLTDSDLVEGESILQAVDYALNGQPASERFEAALIGEA